MQRGIKMWHSCRGCEELLPSTERVDVVKAPLQVPLQIKEMTPKNSKPKKMESTFTSFLTRFIQKLCIIYEIPAHSAASKKANMNEWIWTNMNDRKYTYISKPRWVRRRAFPVYVPFMFPRAWFFIPSVFPKQLSLPPPHWWEWRLRDGLHLRLDSASTTFPLSLGSCS